jgi:hypothetical protein
MTSAVPLIDDAAASPEVRPSDDIHGPRHRLHQQFLGRAGNDPATLKRIWEGLKQVMAPGRWIR